MIYINNNMMKCKQKVNMPPIPSLLTCEEAGIFGNSIDKGEKQENTRCQSKNPVIKHTEILSYGLDKIRLNL